MHLRKNNIRKYCDVSNGFGHFSYYRMKLLLINLKMVTKQRDHFYVMMRRWVFVFFLEVGSDAPRWVTVQVGGWGWQSLLAVFSCLVCLFSSTAHPPPRLSACLAVMVSVPAWLLSALSSSLYYPAGRRFIMAALVSSANFLTRFSARLLSKITKGEFKGSITVMMQHPSNELGQRSDTSAAGGEILTDESRPGHRQKQKKTSVCAVLFYKWR